jgi:hypothetical protein
MDDMWGVCFAVGGWWCDESELSIFVRGGALGQPVPRPQHMSTALARPSIRNRVQRLVVGGLLSCWTVRVADCKTPRNVVRGL